MARTRLQLRQLQELCSFGPMAAPNTVLVGQHSICLFTDFVFTWRGGSSSISFSRGANSFGARDLCIYRFRFHAARSVQFVYLSISFSRGAVVALVRQRSLFRRLGNVQFVYRYDLVQVTGSGPGITIWSRYYDQVQISGSGSWIWFRYYDLVQALRSGSGNWIWSRYYDLVQVSGPGPDIWIWSRYLDLVQVLRSGSGITTWSRYLDLVQVSGSGPGITICLSISFIGTICLSISFSRGAVVAPAGQHSICSSVQFVYRFRFHAVGAICSSIGFVFTRRGRFRCFGWAMFNLFIDFVSTRCAHISLWLGNVQFVHLSISLPRGAVAALVGQLCSPVMFPRGGRNFVHPSISFSRGGSVGQATFNVYSSIP